MFLRLCKKMQIQSKFEDFLQFLGEKSEFVTFFKKNMSQRNRLKSRVLRIL